MSISVGWSRRSANGAILGEGPQGLVGPAGPQGPVGVPTPKLLIASAWWYYASPPADSSNRYFSSAGNTYADNAASLGFAAAVAADGILFARRGGRYKASISWGNNHGAVGGSYLGARAVLNSVTRLAQVGVHVAATADTDTFYGGSGTSSNIITMNANDYIKCEAWSTNGYGMYVFMTLEELNY